MRIVLDATGVLMGAVSSEDQLPLSLAQVEFRSPSSGELVAYTNPAGRFLLPVNGAGAGTVFVAYGSVRFNLGLRTPGRDLGVLVVPVPECIRVRLVDEHRSPITSYFVGFSNPRATPGELPSHMVEHQNGVALIRPSTLSRGDRLFFEGRFGMMIYEVASELHGSNVPIEIVAVPSPVGTLRVVGSMLAVGKASVGLREDRTPRRFSDNLSYLAVVHGQDGVCMLEGIAVGSYQYEVQVNGSKTAEGFVLIHEGQNELRLK